MISLTLPRTCLIPYLVMGTLLGRAYGKWVEGHVDTKENWAFLARFCFLSFDGQFEYLIEFDRDMGTPNLLLYYDDDTQWPAVYHSSKTCKEREAVLNKEGRNQIISLSHWYPDTEASGCVVTKQNKELPAEKSSNKTKTTLKPTAKTKYNVNSTSIEYPHDPLYYEQFLKTTMPKSKTTSADTNVSAWYEILPTDDLNFTTTVVPEDEWESIEPDKNESRSGDLKDVEILFDNNNSGGRKIKRSTFELYERFRRRRLNSDSNQNGNSNTKGGGNMEKLVVSCHHSRRFKSARERWWFIAISNCDSPKGLDVRYKFLMTNGPDDDFWHTHFSADEFYVLPVLIAYAFAYVIVMVAVVICSVELKSRHLLHTTYKLFLISIVTQHSGIIIQTLAYIKYALNGFGSENMRTVGQFLCGVSETTFLLLLVLMAKGYTITRGRLKVGFTIKLTVFMCCYILTYVVLFVHQAKAFDPGDVLYLYESPAGYGLIVLRVLAWCMFAYSSFFTVKKYPQKNTFYGPFCICGTLWFFAGPLFILTANSYIDKWVRESVVTAVLLFITFNGHFMFLILTLPIFANKNFPYHVRTTQIGVMEVAGTADIDFGHNAYHPTSGAAQTVIIPLTRRTEELIGNMYSQYMASAPPISLGNESPKENGVLKRLETGSSRNNLVPQDSSDTNNSEDIKPYLPKVKEIFTVEGQMAKIESLLPDENKQTTIESVLPTQDPNKLVKNGIKNVEGSKNDLPTVLRSRRNILEPIKRDVPSWSLAKGPCVVAMQLKKDIGNGDTPVSPNPSLSLSNGKKVPPVRNSLQPSSGEISTIHEGHIQSYQSGVSRATIDLFTVGHDKG